MEFSKTHARSPKISASGSFLDRYKIPKKVPYKIPEKVSGSSQCNSGPPGRETSSSSSSHKVSSDIGRSSEKRRRHHHHNQQHHHKSSSHRRHGSIGESRERSSSYSSPPPQSAESPRRMPPPPPPPPSTLPPSPSLPPHHEPEVASLSQDVDIFPTLSDSATRLELGVPEKKSQIATYVNIMKGSRVYFHPLDSETWTENIGRHYDGSQCEYDVFTDRIDWARVERRLQRPVKPDRNNEDVRMLHRWNNSYLVKRLFTFGQRTPEPGTEHLIQTSNAPMLFYQLVSGEVRRREQVRRKKHKVYDGSRKMQSPPTPRWFCSFDQRCHEVFVLEPNKVYAVKAGTTYTIVTSQKTFFKLDVVTKETARDLEARGIYRFSSPTSSRRWISKASREYGTCSSSSYDIPPATPIAAAPPSDPTVELEPYVPDLQQQQQAVEDFDEYLRSLEVVAADPQQQLVFYEATPAVSQQQQQQPAELTWIVQPDAATNTDPVETRDVAVETDPTITTTCAHDDPTCQATLNQQQQQRRTEGLGIARKRISRCMMPEEEDDEQQQQRKRRKTSYEPMDLTVERNPQVFPSPCPTVLPPAPRDSYEDSGVFMPCSDDDDDDDTSTTTTVERSPHRDECLSMPDIFADEDRLAVETILCLQDIM